MAGFYARAPQLTATYERCLLEQSARARREAIYGMVCGGICTGLSTAGGAWFLFGLVGAIILHWAGGRDERQRRLENAWDDVRHIEFDTHGEPSASARENGLFHAGRHGDRTYVYSDDFHHDAVLYITGDFLSADQRMVYAEEIARRLNVATPPENA